MVKIVDFKTYQNDDGQDYNALVLQGGLESVRSQESGQIYFTARTTKVPCTFNETMCKSLIGTDLPGEIQKVEAEPYQYQIPNTDEVVELSHRFVYISERESVIIENVIKDKELVM
jgi:hypothetical protein